MKPIDIASYTNFLSPEDQKICNILSEEINVHLTDCTSKLRHGHPVWFLNENPIVGYSKQKRGIVLLFRSGQGFDEPNLKAEGKFKAAEVVYTDSDQINITDLMRRLDKATTIKRDYKNIVKRKGILKKVE